jgi:hypothetical protein
VLLGAEISDFRGGAPTRHRVRDLSSTGARIDGAASLTEGSMVVVTLGSLIGVAATVAWVRDGDAGLSFETEIDPDSARARSPAPLAPKFAPSVRTTGGGSTAAPTAGWAAQLHDPYRTKRR